MPFGGLLSAAGGFYCIFIKNKKRKAFSWDFSSPRVNYYLKINRRMRWIIWSRHGNGCGFDSENTLWRTQGGDVKIAGCCSWINNKQAFLAERNEPVRGSNFMQEHNEGTYFAVTLVFAE